MKHRGNYKVSKPILDDAGRRICRVCHSPVQRAENARRWPIYCSTKCYQWLLAQKTFIRERCKCGRFKVKYSWYCDDVECRKHRTLIQRVGNYGLNLARANQMMDEQNHCCPICGVGITWATCHIDHDHACCPQNPTDSGSPRLCGKCVRGLLCPGCNVGLGNFKDSPDALVSAAAYLIARSTEVLSSETPVEVSITLPKGTT